MPNDQPPVPSSVLTGPLVVALAYDRLCTFEFGIAVEVFGLSRPEMGSGWYRFAVAGVDAGPMRATGGLTFTVDGGLDLLEQADLIIAPGWRGIDEPVPDALCTALRAAHQRGARVISFCSGVFVLAASGLLDGRQATTHWRYTDTLHQRFPTIHVTPDVLYVDTGTVMTSAGTAAGLDLCLHIIRRDFGTDAANSVARRLILPAHRDGGQAQFIRQAVPRPHESTRLGPLLDHMRRTLDGTHTVEALARRVGMSRRTFLRRFEAATGTTPARWLLTERLNRARSLLETTQTSIEEIAVVAGFGSAATLRHHFRQVLSTTPGAYREAFGPHSDTSTGSEAFGASAGL